MNWIRLILIVMLVFLGRSLYQSFKRKITISGQKEPSGEIVGGKMVKDEICGTYIPVKDAIVEKNGDGVHYFCSAQCREHYLLEQGKRTV